MSKIERPAIPISLPTDDWEPKARAENVPLVTCPDPECGEQFMLGVDWAMGEYLRKEKCPHCDLLIEVTLP